MGCGASVDKRGDTAGALNPGELRDRSLQGTVALHGGVAQAGARASPEGPGAAGAAAPAAAAPAPAAAHAPPSRTGSAASGQPPQPVHPPTHARPDSAVAGARPPSAAAPPAAGSRPPSAPPGAPVQATAGSRPPSAAPGAPATHASAAAVQATSAAPGNRPASAAPGAQVLAAGGSRPASAVPAKAASPAGSRPASAAPGPHASDVAAPVAAPAQPQPPPVADASAADVAAAAPQPRMVDCAVSLRFLIDFCATLPEDMPTWKAVTDVIVPATAHRRCRYVEMLEPGQVGHCDYFISHRWATPFSHLVRYVRKHLVELGDVREAVEAEAEAEAAGGARDADEPAPVFRKAEEVYVWCDIFAINQHPGQVQADDLSQLQDCVRASKQTLLCLDDRGLVLTRIWCLYEIWHTVLAGGPPQLAVLGYDVNPDAFKEVYITLDVAEAQATVDSDRVRILDDIAASTGLQELNLVIKQTLVESTQAEAENAQRVLLPQCKDWKDFQRVIEALNKHTQMLTALGRSAESTRYSHIIQSVSKLWQDANAKKDEERERKAAESAGSPAAYASGGGEASVPDWHWTTYPREPELRKAVDKARAAAAGGRFDDSLRMLRDAAARAEQLAAAAPGGTSAAKLDAGGCWLALAEGLAGRGFLDQARTQGGEPGVAAFKEAAGADSLTYASAAFTLAVLMKNDWQRKELRTELLEAAYGIQSRQLGPRHGATLDTLKERAELVYNTGDFVGGIDLYKQCAVGLSGGADLTQPPPAGGGADAAGKTRPMLSKKAVEAWFMLCNYLGNAAGREEEGIHACRALLPYKRRDNISRLRAALGDPEHGQTAAEQLAALGLASDSHAIPAGVDDPDDVRWDMLLHVGELQVWATALAKMGRLEDSVRIQWRMADVYRSSKEMRDMEMQLPTGKVSMVLAYERGLMVDMSVPGVAAVAARMLASGKGPSAAPAGDGSTGGGGASAVTAADGPGGTQADDDPYSGQGYVELLTQMSKLWGEQDYAGAEALCRRIVALQERGHGANSKQVVDARSQLASLLRSAGRNEDAVAEMRAALAAHEKILSGKDPTMRQTLQSLADMLPDRAEAEECHKRAVALVEKVYGPSHMDVGMALVSYGAFLMGDMGRMDEGKQVLARGTALQTQFQEQQQAVPTAY